ncbi:hypothetical protein F511_21955 [Dorcoceras hygrometricum]|uniref:Uncharacterized protein n=1 Tax=Dorcoceras hygrometricum TaxID=472368 RepID=A0A2Z7CAX7_9LAMI|nr:hypothetical protein F511_21955 [Dorcoceras hygrometricum]
MSLFDLRDVCIVIGFLAILDLPMVVDLIGICVLKGPYCTLTTDWFLQALSVIPRGSWGDVARRFTMIRWCLATMADPDPVSQGRSGSLKFLPREAFNTLIQLYNPYIGCLNRYLAGVYAPGSDKFHKETGTSKVRPTEDRLIRSTTRNTIPPSICTRRSDHDRILLVKTIGKSPITAVARRCKAAHDGVGGGVRYPSPKLQFSPSTLGNRNLTPGKRVKVRRLSCRVSMAFRVVRTNQYNQDLGLIHSTNGNHLESPNEGSSIDHQRAHDGTVACAGRHCSCTQLQCRWPAVPRAACGSVPHAVQAAGTALRPPSDDPEAAL